MTVFWTVLIILAVAALIVVGIKIARRHPEVAKKVDDGVDKGIDAATEAAKKAAEELKK